MTNPAPVVGKWYARPGGDSFEIVAFDPATEKTEVVPIPTPGAIVRNMAVDGARGRIWLALSGTGRIGRIDVSPSRGALSRAR